jgi:tetraacyldisaccharide 4'-kinase
VTGVKAQGFGEWIQAGIPRPVLRFFSWPYGFAVLVRNALFDWQILKVRSTGVPVISVGNMTAGGTGKTPVVEFITRHCLKRGKKAAVISRGYRRESRGAVVVSDGSAVLADAVSGGDEPVQIARKFPQACVVVGERRVDAAQIAVGQLGAEVLILDDGFQHRYLHRDLDIVLIDVRRYGGQDLMLPAGTRREPWSGLRRAHVVAFSKVNNRPEIVQTALSRLRRWYDGPVVQFHSTLECIRRSLDGAVMTLDQLRHMPLLAFSGIGDHGGFVEDLGAMGLTVRSDRCYPDHHSYSLEDVRSLIETLQASGAEGFMTTEKDAMRLSAEPQLVERFLRVHPVYHACIVAEMVEGEDRFLALIDACLDRGSDS